MCLSVVSYTFELALVLAVENKLREVASVGIEGAVRAYMARRYLEIQDSGSRHSGRPKEFRKSKLLLSMMKDIASPAGPI